MPRRFAKKGASDKFGESIKALEEARDRAETLELEDNFPKSETEIFGNNEDDVEDSEPMIERGLRDEEEEIASTKGDNKVSSQLQFYRNVSRPTFIVYQFLEIFAKMLFAQSKLVFFILKKTLNLII